MELNWAPQNRWQRDRHGPVDPLSPYSSPAPVAPGRPEPEARLRATRRARDEAPPEQLTEPQDVPPESEPLAAHRRARRTPLAWLRKVSFRSRISILVGVAVGIAVAMASLVSYIAVSQQLEGQVNSNLQDAVNRPSRNVRSSSPLQRPPGITYVPPTNSCDSRRRRATLLQVITQNSYEAGLPGDKRLFPISTAGASRP